MAPVKSKDAEAPKKKPAVKAAPQKVEKMILQFQEGEWELSSVKEQAIAAYVAEGHRASSIKNLTVYLKPEERKAYYVINEKNTGDIDLL